MKIRIKFTKHGIVKYIGHLDLMRYFQKAFRRTDIEMIYSKGFSPHMLMSFAAPLGVGVEGYGEYFDVEIGDNEDISTVKDRLNKEMAEGIEILDAFLLPDNAGNAMASVAAADYEICFYQTNPLSHDLIDKFNDAEKVEYVKTQKSGELVINIKDYVFELYLKEDNVLFAKVDASSSGNLRPAVLTEALLKLGGKSTDLPYHIVRREVYHRNSSGKLLTLGEFDD